MCPTQPDNYFQDIEQACFSPSNMVPGIGPSADPVLQARMFSYPDAHRYRVGPNYFQLPPNRPRNQVYAPCVRDGPGTMNGNYGGDPDYVFSQLRPVSVSKRVQVPTHEHFDGKVTSVVTEFTDKDYVQARELWKIICGEDKGKRQFFNNIAPTIKDLPVKLQGKVLGRFILEYMAVTPTNKAERVVGLVLTGYRLPFWSGSRNQDNSYSSYELVLNWKYIYRWLLL